MKHQCIHVMARGGMRLPVAAAHDQGIAGAHHAVMQEAVATLGGGRQQQGGFVPVADMRLDAGGNEYLAVEGALQRGVAADVVGVRMGVDEPGKSPSRQRRLYEFDGPGGMADIAAVDQRDFIVVE